MGTKTEAIIFRAVFIDGYFVLQIEVGTPVARRPPRRSRRAELPHRAPRWTRSQCDAGPRFVVGLDHAFPVF